MGEKDGCMGLRKHKLLFVAAGNANHSRMAAGFARAKRRDDLDILSASIASTDSEPLAESAARELGVDIAGESSVLLPDAAGGDCDLVISLCSRASARCGTLSGNPLHLHWEVGEEATGDDDAEMRRAAYQRVARQLQTRMDELFDHGYLVALLSAKAQADVVLDHLSDGVIVHDLNRRILGFNKAAEQITGYRRKDVLNKDCHEVMAGGLCGGKCAFCDGMPIAEHDQSREVEIATASGDRRRIQMNVTCIRDQEGRATLVLACFRDITREQQLARRLGEIQQFAGIIGRDPKMMALYDLIPELAESTAPVMIQGESGTGKELIAAALHNEGPRGTRLFVPVNCGALPEGLLESELFGHVRGAFTGAIRDKKGRFELADGGTIFLDEIGDISPAMQVKLLRVLQEGCFERVGSEKTIKVNVRVISATNKVLAKEMAEGRFREDLYYRLSVVPLTVPPLRDRRNDIPLLAHHFLVRLSESAGKKGSKFSAEAMDLMMSYAWPGNVRELQNWIQFALIKCKGDVIRPEHLPPVALAPMQGAYAAKPEAGARGIPGGRFKLDAAMVQEALAKTRGNKVEAARLLGISRATLYRFIDSSG